MPFLNYLKQVEPKDGRTSGYLGFIQQKNCWILFFFPYWNIREQYIQVSVKNIFYNSSYRAFAVIQKSRLCKAT